MTTAGSAGRGGTTSSVTENVPARSKRWSRLGVPASHLEDACQEVFVDVFRYLPRFRREADFRTWLYRICLSRARVTRRRARLWSLF